MSNAEEKKEKRRGEGEVPPTESFGAEGRGPGGKIGQFRIESELGRGGMGVVYLAHDTKLDRQVAIKSLPAELMDNPKARSRFSREARVLASLNHPNIATIYEELKEAEGAGFLVLEYVPGDTLAERIGRKKLKVEEVLTIGLQIAEAVAAAHEKGVIHRDLKAGNIKITPEGKVKVLDFGLAKAVGGETLNQQSTITEPGRIIGTPAYMSPEQARGEQTDERSDIWSFGCVLYEMLTGSLPFEGGTPSDTLAGILEREPDWQALPKSTPANIPVLLRRCLTKDPRRRLQHIGDARIEISETLNVPASAPPVTTPSSISAESGIAAKAKLRRMAMMISVVVIIALSAVAVRFILVRPTQPSSKQIRLVVLPFENLGSADKEYYADGITNEVTSRLARLHGLSVISPRTAMQYKKTEKNAQAIGKELGVDYILEGLVQFERPSDPNSPMRVMPRLIRASDDTLLLAPVYHEDMSEVFRVQSEVAERVAQALDVTLLEPERLALASEPTKDLEAWDYYLQGQYFFERSFRKDDYVEAIRMYKQAVKLDPTFALAYARLSITHSAMYWHHHDHSKARLGKAEDAVNKAFDLNPELPEVHIARGIYYYHGHLDYDRALEEFAIAEKQLPDSIDLQSSIAWVQRRQGKFEQALATMKKTEEVDRRSKRIPYVIGETFLLIRNYDESERYLDRSISLAPDWARPYAWKVQLYLTRDGNKEDAWGVFEQMPKKLGSLEDPFLALWFVRLNMFDRDYAKALSGLSSGTFEAFESQWYFIPKALLYAQINGLMGNSQLEQDYYNSACSMLKPKIEEDPNDSRLHSSLGIAYAGLGRKEDAVREGKLAVELLPVSKEHWRGLFRVEALANIYVTVGEFDKAIDQLEFLLSVPGELSIPLLRLDPAWDPLLDHPRFKKLLETGK
jgi:serine/threonine protein kinase/tetratricopeptide (TPR) repeat protein